MKIRGIIQFTLLCMSIYFLIYSNYALAVDIYDPMNPTDTITPIPNNDSQKTQESDTEIVFESAESTKTDVVSTEESSEEFIKHKQASETDKTKKSLKSKRPERLEKAKKSQKSDKMERLIRQSQAPLMLDDDFFSGTHLVMPNPISGSGAGEGNAFSQVALSGYLLSGVVLYGEVPAGHKIKRCDFIA